MSQKNTFTEERRRLRENVSQKNTFTEERRRLRENVSQSCLVRWEGAAEGGADDWGEVVTR